MQNVKTFFVVYALIFLYNLKRFERDKLESLSPSHTHTLSLSLFLSVLRCIVRLQIFHSHFRMSQFRTYSICGLAFLTCRIFDTRHLINFTTNKYCHKYSVIITSYAFICVYKTINSLDSLVQLKNSSNYFDVVVVSEGTF